MDKVKKVGRDRPKKSNKKKETSKKYGKYSKKKVRYCFAGKIKKSK